MATERLLLPDRRALGDGAAARLLGRAEARVALLIVVWKLLAFLVVVEGYRAVPLDEEEWRGERGPPGPPRGGGPRRPSRLSGAGTGATTSSWRTRATARARPRTRSHRCSR